MAALLIGLSVAAVLMTAVMPAWRQMVRREREAELVFRGEQYVRAIGLFQKKSGPGVLPPDIDALVNGRFLRKKFKDPITNQDFELLSPTQAAGTSSPVQGGAGQQGGRGVAAPPAAGALIGAASGGRGSVGGIIGVASKSKDTSLRVYNGRTRYNEWQFVYVAQAAAPGAGGAAGPPGQGRGGGGQRGGQPPVPGGFQGGVGRQGQGQGRGTGQGPAGRGIQPGSPFPPPASPSGPRR